MRQQLEAALRDFVAAKNIYYAIDKVHTASFFRRREMFADGDENTKMTREERRFDHLITYPSDTIRSDEADLVSYLDEAERLHAAIAPSRAALAEATASLYELGKMKDAAHDVMQQAQARFTALGKELMAK
jgi:hypothetical protein